MNRLRVARDAFLAAVTLIVAVRRLDQSIVYLRARVRAWRRERERRSHLIVVEGGVILRD